RATGTLTAEGDRGGSLHPPGVDVVIHDGGAIPRQDADAVRMRLDALVTQPLEHSEAVQNGELDILVRDEPTVALGPALAFHVERPVGCLSRRRRGGGGTSASIVRSGLGESHGRAHARISGDRSAASGPASGTTRSTGPTPPGVACSTEPSAT